MHDANDFGDGDGWPFEAPTSRWGFGQQELGGLQPL